MPQCLTERGEYSILSLIVASIDTQIVFCMCINHGPSAPITLYMKRLIAQFLALA